MTSDTFVLLGRSLDAQSLRHEAVAANLANSNTPGYQRRDVSVTFPEVLAARSGRGGGDATALIRNNPRHLFANGRRDDGSAPRVITDTSGAMRLDGSNIDPDAEAARLAEAEITYAALTQAMGAQFAALKLVITGNGR